MKSLTALLFLALTLSPTRADDTTKEKPMATPWSGLILKDVTKAMPDLGKETVNSMTFGFSVINNAEEYKKLVSAETTKPARVPEWMTWGKEIDWDKEVVVTSVLMVATNSLKFEEWKEGKDGIGQITIRWSGIEPFYGNRFPAVMCRAPRKGLKAIKVEITDVGKPVTHTLKLKK